MEQLSPMTSVLFLFLVYSGILVGIFRPKLFVAVLLLVLNAVFLLGLCCFGEEVRVLSAGLVGCEVGVLVCFVCELFAREEKGSATLEELKPVQMKEVKSEVREELSRYSWKKKPDASRLVSDWEDLGPVADLVQAHEEKRKRERLEDLFQKAASAKTESELNGILEEIHRLKA